MNKNLNKELTMEQYIDAYYNPDDGHHNSVIGNVDRNVGSVLECSVLGKDVRDIKEHLYMTDGGIFNQRVYRISPFKKFKAPDFYLPDSDILGDVKRVYLETTADKWLDDQRVLGKVDDCIGHTLDKLSEKICILVDSYNSAICPFGILEFPDYRGEDEQIFELLVNGIMAGLCPNFNRVDSILIYSNPASYVGSDEIIGGNALQINRSGRIRGALIKDARVIDLYSQ